MTVTRAAYALIFITVLLDMLSFGLIIPSLPKLIEQSNSGDMSAGRHSLIFTEIFAAAISKATPLPGAPWLFASLLATGFAIAIVAGRSARMAPV